MAVSVPVMTYVRPASAPAAGAAVRCDAGTSMRTPATRSRSSNSRFRGSSIHDRTDSASTGPISGCCSCSTVAPTSVSIDQNARDST